MYKYTLKTAFNSYPYNNTQKKADHMIKE